MEGTDTIVIVGAGLLVHDAAHQIEREQCIRTDLLDQQNRAVSQARRGLDHLATIEKILCVGGMFVVATVNLPSLIGPAEQIAVFGVFGNFIVQGRVAHADTQLLVCGDIFNTLSPIVHHTAISESLAVLLCGS